MPHAMPNQTRLGDRKKYLVWAAAEVMTLCASVGNCDSVGCAVRLSGDCASVSSGTQRGLRWRWCASVGTGVRLQPSARFGACSSAIQATTGEPWRASGKGVHTVATQSVIAPERDDVVHGGAKAQLRRLAGGAWSLCAVHPPGQHTKEPVFVDTTEPQLSEAALGHPDLQSCWTKRGRMYAALPLWHHCPAGDTAQAVVFV